MKKVIFLLIFLFNLSFALLAQKQEEGYSVKISSKPQAILIPERVVEKNEIEVQTDSLQKDLKVYVETMKSEKFISDNVIVNMDADVIDEEEGKAVKVTYSYALKSDTIKYETDDFLLGKYTLDASNAMKVTLEIMKRSIENQLSKYIQTTKNISFSILGNADATAIAGKIPYNEEYGVKLLEQCTVGQKLEEIHITKASGITSNEELAFLRSYTVRQFIENKISELNHTNREYTHMAHVSEYKGGEHRRVTIEMIIHNAFNDR